MIASLSLVARVRLLVAGAFMSGLATGVSAACDMAGVPSPGSLGPIALLGLCAVVVGRSGLSGRAESARGTDDDRRAPRRPRTAAAPTVDEVVRRPGGPLDAAGLD